MRVSRQDRLDGTLSVELHEIVAEEAGITTRALCFEIAETAARRYELRTGDGTGVGMPATDGARQQARQLFADFIAELPAGRRRAPEARLGTVRLTASATGLRHGEATAHVLRACAAVVFFAEDPMAPWRSPWVGEQATVVPRSLPVILDRGATLTLFIHLLESAEGTAAAQLDRRARIELDPCAGDPRWRLLARELSPRIDQRALLALEFPQLPALWRSVHWSRPAGALLSDQLDGLSIHFDAPASPPPASLLLLEGLSYLGSEGSATHWLGDWSLCVDGRLQAGSEPLAIRLPHDLAAHHLSGVVAPGGRAAVRDPLSGTIFGRAPILATDLVAGDVLA